MRRNTEETGKAGARKKVDKMSIHFVLPLVGFYCVVGLLLILLDDLVTNVAAWALAAGLVLVGAWLLLRYFRSGMEERVKGIDLAIGLVVLLAGILLITSPSDMKEVFPKIWGLSLIFGAFLKVQYAFDEKTLKMDKWWIMLILAVVSLTIGILALLNKSVFGDNQNLIIGIFMLSEAVLDLVTFFLLSRGMKRQTTGQPATAPVTAAPVTEVPVAAAPAAAAPADETPADETPAAPETPDEAPEA